MSDSEKAPKISKKEASKWAKRREFFLWAIVATQIVFFAGTFVGGMWERNHVSELNSVKESAIQQSKTQE